MKILVTGAAGFIGFHTCLKLINKGHDVYGIDNINDYYDQKLKQTKYDLYNKLDPNATEFYNYEHLIHPEKFSIPDDFAYLSEGYYIKDI